MAKLTKRRLKKLIQEELQRLLQDAVEWPEALSPGAHRGHLDAPIEYKNWQPAAKDIGIQLKILARKVEASAEAATRKSQAGSLNDFKQTIAFARRNSKELEKFLQQIDQNLFYGGGNTGPIQ